MTHKDYTALHGCSVRCCCNCKAVQRYQQAVPGSHASALAALGLVRIQSQQQVLLTCSCITNATTNTSSLAGSVCLTWQLCQCCCCCCCCSLCWCQPVRLHWSRLSTGEGSCCTSWHCRCCVVCLWLLWCKIAWAQQDGVVIDTVGRCCVCNQVAWCCTAAADIWTGNRESSGVWWMAGTSISRS